jgi:osmotically-inducible protein OsmY
MLLNPDGRVKGFVMHAGHIPGHNLIVLVAWVREVDKENVHLSVEKAALKSLPEYSPDFALADEVNNAIWNDEILRVTDYKDIEITVENGIVFLRGHVNTSMNRTRAEYAARLIHGMLGIENHLVVDGDMAIEVAQVLGNDERTQLESVTVSAQNEVIILNGQVASAAIRQAAEELAASVPQVRGVVNNLRAPNVVIDPQEEQVLDPPIRGEVYATDMFLGLVERIIINPHNCRVTALIVHGDFPDLEHVADRNVLDKNTQQERWVVVPTLLERYETDNSIQLNISGNEAARYHDFNPADFVSPPDEGWEPPYPYHWSNVLFENKSENE